MVETGHVVAEVGVGDRPTEPWVVDQRGQLTFGERGGDLVEPGVEDPPAELVRARRSDATW